MMRPRQHEVEDESRRAFCAAFPARVVLRDERPDYGFDYQLELFADGEMTGVRWFAQIKASDHSRPTAPFSVKRLHQYLFKTQAPVLLAHYSASTETLRYMWDDEAFEQLYLRDSNWAARSEVALDFSKAKVLDRTAVDQLLTAELPVKVARKHADLVPLFVASRDEDMSSWLGEYLRTMDQTWLFIADERQSRIRVAWTANLCTVSWRAGETWHDVARIQTPRERPPSSPWFVGAGVDWRQAARTIIVAVLTCSALVRPTRQGLRRTLAWLFEPKSGPELASVDPAHLALGYLVDGTLGELVLLLRYGGFEFDPRYWRWLLLAPLAGVEDYRYLDETWRHLCALMADKSPDANEQATLRYSEAIRHLHSQEYRAALSALRMAARIVPGYRHEAYWHEAVAVALFELGRWRIAAAHYRSAIELGGDATHLTPRLADCLMMSGRFTEAQEAFGSVEINVVIDPSFVIKRLVCSYLAASIPDATPHMVTMATLEGIDSLVQRGDLVGAERALLAAIRESPTAGPLWYNLGQAYVMAEDLLKAADCFFCAAALCPRDASAWAHLVMLLFVHPEEDWRNWIRPAVWAAFLSNGQTFIDELDQIVRQQLPEHQGAIRRVLSQTLDVWKQRAEAHNRATRMVVSDGPVGPHLERRVRPIPSLR